MRTDHIREYYFEQKLREVRELEKDGKRIINLGIGSPDMAPGEKVKEELTRSLSEAGAFQYKGGRGIPEFRQAISLWYQKIYGVFTDSEREVLPVMGSKEAIGYLSLAFLEKGDKVLVPDPGYPAYTSAATIAGAEVVPYHLKPQNQWYPEREELERLSDEKVKLIWVNYPHMPTGQAASPKVFRELVSFARERGILICHDNPYSLILNDTPLSIFQVPGAKDTTIELNSLSKSHNMAGARMGMVIGAKDKLDLIFRIQSQFSSGMFEPLQRAAITALNYDKEWYEELNNNYTRRRKIVWKILDELACSYEKNSQGMFVWARVPSHISNGEEFSDHLLYKPGIFVTPGMVFGKNGEKHIRVSLCASEEILTEALERVITIPLRLSALVASQPK